MSPLGKTHKSHCSSLKGFATEGADIYCPEKICESRFELSFTHRALRMRHNNLAVETKGGVKAMDFCDCGKKDGSVVEEGKGFVFDFVSFLG